MTNPTYVANCIELARQVLDTTTNVSDAVRKLWSDRLVEVSNGRDWAPNPHGYFLKGFAPHGKRACVINGKTLTTQEFTARQFAYALQQGWFNGVDAKMRQVSKQAIAEGVFFSMAREDSHYGLKATRQGGNKVVTSGLNKKTRAQLGETLEKIENAPSTMGKAIGLETFENSIANAILACNKPVKVAKPAADKPAKAAKPAADKPATRKPRAA